MANVTHASWYENRKSRIGLSPLAKEPPPFGPGKPWWTSPPVAPPQPEHIEYVMQYRAELVARKATVRDETKLNGLLAHVNAWLTAARRLLHEETCAETRRRDLLTTDGILVASCNAMSVLCAELVKHGGAVPDEVQQVIDAARARASKVTRERAIERAKQNNGVR